MTAISVVIITYNEEKHIGDCLNSVKNVADDVVVVDSFSTDQTEAICRMAGARFIQHVFEGHIEQKNFALSKAMYEHVLSLDADESLSPELEQSILLIKNNWVHDGYLMNRLNNFCGSWIHYAGWYPDRKVRLFDRRSGKWGGVNPHDKFMLKEGASTGLLKGDLLHLTADSEEQYVKKMERYAGIAAEELFQQGRKTSRLVIYIKTAVHFIRNYFLMLGFLDGRAGLRVCKIGAWYTYMKYSKLLRLNRE